MDHKRAKLTTRRRGHLVPEHRGGEHTMADLTERFSAHRAAAYRVPERLHDVHTEAR